MSDKCARGYTVLHLRFKLRVPPDALFAQSREAATVIASVEGLIWKLWLFQEDEFAVGGTYLFASRRAAESYLKHPVVQAVSSHPAVVSTQHQLWEVENFLSGLTRAPLPGIHTQCPDSAALLVGDQ